MKHVLHIPPEWKTEWESIIEAIKVDPGFKSNHGEYCRRCRDSGWSELSFYEPLAKTANAVLDVLSQSRFKRSVPESLKCITSTA